MHFEPRGEAPFEPSMPPTMLLDGWHSRPRGASSPESRPTPQPAPSGPWAGGGLSYLEIERATLACAHEAPVVAGHTRSP